MKWRGGHRMTTDLEALYARMLARYERAALACADAGRATSNELAGEMVLLFQALQGIRQRPEGAAWLSAHLPVVHAEWSRRITKTVPDWRQNPPGWLTTHLLAGGIARELVRLEGEED